MDSGKFKTILGNRLKLLSRAAYPLENAGDQGPLEFQFYNDSFLVLETESDGQSVSFSLDPLSFSAQVDTHVSWHRVIIQEPSLVGAQLTQIDAFYEGVNESRYIAAWRVWFGSNFVCYANNGDNSEIFISNEPEWLSEGWRVVATINCA